MIAASLLTNNKFLEIQMRCKYSEIYSIMGGAWENVCGAATVQRHKVQVVHLEHVLVSAQQGDLNPLTLVTPKNLKSLETATILQIVSGRMLWRYAYQKPLIVKFPDRCEW